MFHVTIGIMNNNCYTFIAPNHEYKKCVSIILLYYSYDNFTV